MQWHSLRSLFRDGWRDKTTILGVILGGVVVYFFDADTIRAAGDRLDALAEASAKFGGAIAAIVLIMHKDKPHAGDCD